MKRPAPPLPAAAVVVSDQTSLAVVGLDARQFRAFVREHGVPHVEQHRHVLARVSDVLEALDRLAGGKPRTSWSEEDVVAVAAGRRRAS